MFCTRCGKANTDTSQFCFSCGQALVPGAKAATTYAGFWARWAALFIDSLILGVATFIGAVAVAALGFTAGEDAALIAGVAGYYGLSIVGSWLYFALLESSSHQATPGKRAVGAIVTDEAGQRISFGRASGRFFAKILSQLSLGVGWLMAAFTQQKRGLHDFVAGTLIVNRDPSRSAPAVVVGVAVAAATIPMIGIIAAIAIPGLLRARIAGNEQSAIGSMRSITSAQLSYFSKCGGYAPSLPTLATDNLLMSELTTGTVVSRSGYQFSMRIADGGTPVNDPEPGCEGAVSNYFAQASPITVGSTGNRFFVTDERSTIFEDTSDGFRSPRPLD
jgi:uncharacterized RDD family membrane protein YckC/type II secretory pathway pseudopilin PulG